MKSKNTTRVWDWDPSSRSVTTLNHLGQVEQVPEAWVLAAGAMLSALERILRLETGMEPAPDNCITSAVVGIAEDAIAKARGEE